MDNNIKKQNAFISEEEKTLNRVDIQSAFKKTLTFSDGTQKCYYFPNEATNGKDWTEFETICN